MTPKFIGLFNYTAALILVLFGIYALITQKNLIRKIIGMVILQTGTILFYISLAAKHGAAIPILIDQGHHAVIDPQHYANPLPHALMLTAIVVGVSTLGVALSLIASIFKHYGTLEEDEILIKMESSK
ncbi:MAG: cation:proton antiporter subunit C [Candidatus Omnitrophota bacterium]|nr:cation:proton antiporter subunit C [Candidatus Omnitrophota bacterium]